MFSSFVSTKKLVPTESDPFLWAEPQCRTSIWERTFVKCKLFFSTDIISVQRQCQEHKSLLGEPAQAAEKNCSLRNGQTLRWPQETPKLSLTYQPAWLTSLGQKVLNNIFEVQRKLTSLLIWQRTADSPKFSIWLPK